MIDAKQIPDEVVEAGKDAAFNWLRSFMEDDVRVKSMTDDELGEIVLAVCLAALAAWPGMSVAPIPRLRPYKEAETLQHIILPLQETQNGK